MNDSEEIDNWIQEIEEEEILREKMENYQINQEEALLAAEQILDKYGASRGWGG